MSTSTVTDVLAWEALDSRGNPTVACELRTSSGAIGTVAVPSGASTGTHEVRERRDGGDRYGGRGVSEAVDNVRSVLGRRVRGRPIADQQGLDDALVEADGTDDLARLGANAVLAVSLAARVAAAADAGLPLWRHALGADEPTVTLPLPMVNIISGGAHAGGSLDIQDVLAVPLGASSFAEALEWVDRVRRATGAELRERGLDTSLVADEGGFGPRLDTNAAALEVVTSAIHRAGLSAGDQVALALDVAASEFYRADVERYVLAAEGRELSGSEWIDELAGWCRRFPVVSIEDPLAEDDWQNWHEATKALGGRTQIVGDDLFVTNLSRLERGIRESVANAVLVKANQTGTVSRALRVVESARAANYRTVLSARSGDTEDSWLADLAVGWSTGQIKVGSLTRSERTAKWNRLLRLEAELGDRARLATVFSSPPRA